MEQVTTHERLNELLAGTVLLYKHSTRCGISARAIEEVRAFSEGSGMLVARVDVLEDPRLSDQVTRRTGVEHQSPQAILVEGGAPSWSASHHAITRAALRSAVGEGKGREKRAT